MASCCPGLQENIGCWSKLCHWCTPAKYMCPNEGCDRAVVCVHQAHERADIAECVNRFAATAGINLVCSRESAWRVVVCGGETPWVVG